jgi:hypothetical protein
MTPWYCLFYDAEDCNAFALTISTQQNIVESEDWLNLKPENGLDGGSYKHTEETLRKLKGRPSPLKGRSMSEELRAKRRHPKCNTDNYKHPKSAAHIEAVAATKRGISPPTTTCIHCGMVASHGLISRWHNDNCKKK